MPKDTEGMTEYKSRPSQRRVVRRHYGIIKLHAPTMTKPETQTLTWQEYAELVSYARELDYICHSEKIIGKSYSDDWPHNTKEASDAK